MLLMIVFFIGLFGAGIAGHRYEAKNGVKNDNAQTFKPYPRPRTYDLSGETVR